MNTRISAGILGSADGVISISGVIAGGAASGTMHNKIAVIAIGGALAATVSMAGAELLSEDAADWGAICAMGMGTLGGSALPAVPLLFARGFIVWLIVAAVSLVIGLVVGLVRAHVTHRHYLRGCLQTLLVLALGGAVGYGAGALG